MCISESERSGDDERILRPSGESDDDDAVGGDIRNWSDIKRVAETTLPNGRWVSTVWMGLNHRFGDGPPLIFETMVFPSRDDMGDLDSDRYSTEAEAFAGHERMVAWWTNHDEPEERP